VELTMQTRGLVQIVREAIVAARNADRKRGPSLSLSASAVIAVGREVLRGSRRHGDLLDRPKTFLSDGTRVALLAGRSSSVFRSAGLGLLEGRRDNPLKLSNFPSIHPLCGMSCLRRHAS
jgi:hypothetical protein